LRKKKKNNYSYVILASRLSLQSCIARSVGMLNLQQSTFMSINSSLLRTSLPVSDSLKACLPWRILKLWRETGDLVSISNRIRGRPHILQCNDVLYLIRLVRHRLEWFLDELLVLLNTNRFVFSSAMVSFISFVLSVTARSGSWTNYLCYWIPITSYLYTMPPFTVNSNVSASPSKNMSSLSSP
jgi:hypothetical protein